MFKGSSQLFLLFIVFFSNFSFTQLESVFVEKYYISDLNDQSNTTGGVLKNGSTTYRIYADLAKKSKVIRVFGNDKYSLELSSTDTIYNNLIDGQSFGKDFVRSRYSDNLVALDSWITIGQTAKYQGGKAVFGVPKDNDNDGSFIGGANNDGGSQAISGGLLINQNKDFGKPLTETDGMATKNWNIGNWFSNGLVVLGVDSSVFGLGGFKKEFKSSLFELKCDGVEGVDTSLNHVLLAQITTKGDIKFNFNIEVEFTESGKTRRVTYVSKNIDTDSNIVFSPFLSYPFSCGCTDPAFLEYSSANVCDKEGACKTPIVIGCMDQNACNYDPNANKTLPTLCCYPGACNNRDITVVCPSLLEENVSCSIYPNPVENEFIVVDIQTGVSQEVSYEIIDIYGKILISKSLGNLKFINDKINLENMHAGMYQIKVLVGSSVFSKLIIKK